MYEDKHEYLEYGSEYIEGSYEYLEDSLPSCSFNETAVVDSSLRHKP